MDHTLAEYRNLIKEILNRYATILETQPNSEESTYVVFDDERDHYILHTIGWQDKQRIWSTLVYVRIQDGKFWIEQDGLEEGIAADLIAAGVSNENIVLAFHHPRVRPLTEFAVA